jgi:hypothetical protein
MFQLTLEEFENLRLQTARSSWGGRRFTPYAFTEHGVAMLSAVLKSKRAVQMSIRIVRAFVQLRELVAGNRHLAARVQRLESIQTKHASVITVLADEIHNLKALAPGKRRIGFAV